MQSDADGIATFMAITMRDAVVVVVRWGSGGRRDAKLTDITPPWRPVDGVAIPYDGIDKIVEAADSSPDHVYTCARVPSLSWM
jgi:hypothetical protein